MISSPQPEDFIVIAIWLSISQIKSHRNATIITTNPVELHICDIAVICQIARLKVCNAEVIRL
jgi:hypothetical protein